MPIQVHGVLLHAMSGFELSRVRTEPDPLCIFPTPPPHPVQPNRESSGHGHLGDAPLSTHRQVHVLASEEATWPHAGKVLAPLYGKVSRIWSGIACMYVLSVVSRSV
jgi:hypothetical protein